VFITFWCRYNRLLNVIIRSLRDLLKALKGLVVMSQQLEEMANSIFVNQVPTMWAGKVRTGVTEFTHFNVVYTYIQ